MDGPAQSKETIIGLQLQTTEGTAKQDSVVWCPYADASDLGFRGGMTPLDQADTLHQIGIAVPGGSWVEGRLPLRFRPVAGFLNLFFGTGGALNSASRDTYNNPPCLSIIRVDKVSGSQRKIGFMDCRVGSWRLRGQAGRGRPVEFEASIFGKQSFAVTASPSGSFGAPYLVSQAYIDISTAGGSYSQDLNIEEFEITGEENLKDIDQQFRAGTGNTPYRMDCEGEQEISIRVTRDLVDTVLYDLWNSQVDNGSIDSSNALALRFRFIAGGVTCTLTAARCAIREYTDELPGSKKGTRKEVFTVDCYASADGATAALQAGVS
jgi:hypothetical protein